MIEEISAEVVNDKFCIYELGIKLDLRMFNYDIEPMFDLFSNSDYKITYLYIEDFDIGPFELLDKGTLKSVTFNNVERVDNINGDNIEKIEIYGSNRVCLGKKLKKLKSLTVNSASIISSHDVIRDNLDVLILEDEYIDDDDSFDSRFIDRVLSNIGYAHKLKYFDYNGNSIMLNDKHKQIMKKNKYEALLKLAYPFINKNIKNAFKHDVFRMVCDCF